MPKCPAAEILPPVVVRRRPRLAREPEVGGAAGTDRPAHSPSDRHSFGRAAPVFPPVELRATHTDVIAGA